MRFTWFLAFGLLTSSTSCLSAAPPGLLKSEFIYETASFPSCHASTIVEPKGGGLVTAWFGGTHEKHPDVGIWVSRMEAARGQYQWKSLTASSIARPTELCCDIRLGTLCFFSQTTDR